MKKVLNVLLALSLLICFSGCSKNEENEEKDHLARIKEAGYITIATEGAWEPWTYHDADGNLVGFDVEVGQLIAEKLGVKVEFKETQWDAILMGVSSGRFDIACNGVGYTEERAASFNFTDPYVYTDVVLIVRGDETEIKSFEDLTGRRTANSVGSTYAGLAAKYGAVVENVDTLDQTIQLLIDGRIDATINSLDSYDSYTAARPDVNIKIADTAPGDSVVIPIALGEDSQSLHDAINKALQELRDEGKLAELSIKYFGSDKTISK